MRGEITRTQHSAIRSPIPSGTFITLAFYPRTRIALGRGGCFTRVFPRRDIKQSRARTEGRRVPIGPALHEGLRINTTLWLGPVARLFDRPPVLIESDSPVLLYKILTQQKLSRLPVEHVKEPIPIGPQHHLPGLALPVNVGQHGDLRRIPVILITRRELEVPFQLSGIGIERDH